jgi:hypothetical protein
MPPVSASQRTIQPFHALLCAAEPLGTETSEISGMRIVKLIRIALAAPMLAASLKAAVFVGLILNLVNHGSDLLHGRPAWAGLAGLFSKFSTVAHGIPCFFAPNPLSWQGVHANVGIEAASYYSMAPLRRTLGDLVDFDAMSRGTTRLTVGAVNVRTGCMRYFDSRDTRIGPEHVIASGALPPAFPAIRIDGEPYWDGGIYSNTPIEAVLDDNPRRDSLIFAVSVWPPAGAEPESIWQVMGRHKDIQYASKADSHIARQKQIHRLRHVIRELAQLVPEGRHDVGSRHFFAFPPLI